MAERYLRVARDEFYEFWLKCEKQEDGVWFVKAWGWSKEAIEMVIKLPDGEASWELVSDMNLLI